MKRNRYVDLHRQTQTVNYELAEKNTALAGIKGHETNQIDLDATTVISAYRQLLRVEKAFRMSKTDLRARPIYHRTKDDRRAPDHRDGSGGLADTNSSTAQGYPGAAWSAP